MRKLILKTCLISSAFMLMNMPAKRAEAQMIDELKHVVDTIRYSLKVRPRKFLFSFDNRRTFTGGKPVRLSGFRIGLEYNNVVSKFIGFYSLSEPIIKERVVNKFTPTQDTVLDYFDFGYMSFGMDYTFYETKHWQFSIPLQLGIGGGTRDVRDLDTLTILNTQSRGFFPLEMGVYGVYRFYNWLGFGVGLGYRTNLSGFFSVNAFEGVYYSFGLKVYLGQLYRGVFPKKEKTSSQFYPLPPLWRHASQ